MLPAKSYLHPLCVHALPRSKVLSVCGKSKKKEKDRERRRREERIERERKSACVQCVHAHLCVCDRMS